MTVLVDTLVEYLRLQSSVFGVVTFSIEYVEIGLYSIFALS